MKKTILDDGFHQYLTDGASFIVPPGIPVLMNLHNTQVPKDIIPFEKAKSIVKKQEVIDHKWSGKKALLVEDNDLNAEIAEIMLFDLGFDVTRAENGEVALSRLKEAAEPYSIVFMDILMPVLDGYETTKRIREMEGKVGGIPIVAMTANAFAEDKIKTIESGMDDHVQKPLEKDSLIKAIIRVLGE